MAMLRKTTTIGVGLAGALTLSQAPEFAQQYRQRLGGAMDELATIVVDFDADASRNGLTRDEALALYAKSPEPFLNDRGKRMAAVFERMEVLSRQARWFEELPPVARPVALAGGYDEKLMKGAWDAFRPAMPLTPEGAAWGGTGFLSLSGLFLLLTAPFRRRKRSATVSARPAPARRAARGSGSRNA